MESNNELNEIDIENCTCYYFGDIMRAGNFDSDSISLDDKSHKNSYEKNFDYWHFELRIRFDKVDNLIKFMMELGTLYYLILSNTMQFIIRLDILQVKKVVLLIVLLIILQK